MSSRQSECGCSCCLPWSRCCCNTPDDLDGRKVAVRNLKSSQRQQGSANNIAARNSGADKDTNAVFTEGTDDKRRHSEISARSFGAHSLRSTVGSINAAAAAAGSSGDGGTAGMALRRKKKAPQRDDRIAIRVLLLDDTYGTFHISVSFIPCFLVFVFVVLFVRPEVAPLYDRVVYIEAIPLLICLYYFIVSFGASFLSWALKICGGVCIVHRSPTGNSVFFAASYLILADLSTFLSLEVSTRWHSLTSSLYFDSLHSFRESSQPATNWSLRKECGMLVA